MQVCMSAKCIECYPNLYYPATLSILPGHQQPQ